MINYEYLALVQANSAGAITDEWNFADLSGRDNGEYALVEYAPVVAPLRVSRLGGAGSFDDVAEALTVHCLGSTPSQAVDAYERLMRALDLAARWTDEEIDGTVIQIRARIVESTVGELAAVVLGPVPGEAPAQVGAEWDPGIGAWAVRNVVLRFRRRGLWLNPTPDSTTASINGIDVAALSFSSASGRALSPCELTVRATTASASSAATVRGFLLAGPSGHVMLQNLGVGGTDISVVPQGTWSTVADATARGGNIKRYSTASTTGESGFGFTTSIVPPASAKVLHLFVTARNNSPGIDFYVRGSASFSGATVVTGTTVLVPADPVNPGSFAFAYYLGSVSKAVDWSNFQVNLYVQPTGASATTIDFNVMGVVAEHPATRMIAFERVSGPITTNDRRLVVSARPLDGVSPLFASLNSPAGVTTGLQPPTYSGDVYLEAEQTLDVCPFAMRSVAAFPWQLGTTAPAVLPMELTLRRWRGYRVNQ